MAAPRGRQAGFVMPESHRLKIANSNILKRLIDCAEGKIDMSQTQLGAARCLIAKILPDLQSISAELTGKDGGPIETKDVSDLETARRIAFLLAKAGKADK